MQRLDISVTLARAYPSQTFSYGRGVRPHFVNFTSQNITRNPHWRMVLCGAEHNIPLTIIIIIVQQNKSSNIISYWPTYVNVWRTFILSILTFTIRVDMSTIIGYMRRVCAPLHIQQHNNERRIPWNRWTNGWRIISITAMSTSLIWYSMYSLYPLRISLIMSVSWIILNLSYRFNNS